MEYQHGGDIYRNQVELDYSANISPMGLPKGVQAALVKAVGQCHCYPDSSSERLISALSQYHQIASDFLICGNGAADLIFQIAGGLKPESAVLLSPSFLEYEQALAAGNCKIGWYHLPPASGFQFSVSHFLEWLKKRGRTELIFLCNPNNPTGCAVKKEDMIPLLKYCEEHGIYCVIDECFNEFMDEPDQYSLSGQAKEYSHLFILKAFTKLYAMAGVRLGYGICSDHGLLEQMEKVRQPWSVSSLAQAAGEAALKEKEYVNKTRAIVSRERNYMKEQIKMLGFQVYDSMANYIFFREKDHTLGKYIPSLYQQCLEKKILIRSCANYRGLDDSYYRICVRKRKDNERLLAVMKEIVAERNRSLWQKQ